DFFFEGVGTEDFHTFFESLYFYPHSPGQVTIFREGRDGGFSHIFRKSVIFASLSWTESKGIIQRMTPYERIVAIIIGYCFGLKLVVIRFLKNKNSGHTPYDRDYAYFPGLS